MSSNLVLLMIMVMMMLLTMPTHYSLVIVFSLLTAAASSCLPTDAWLLRPETFVSWILGKKPGSEKFHRE